MNIKIRWYKYLLGFSTIAVALTACTWSFFVFASRATANAA